MKLIRALKVKEAAEQIRMMLNAESIFSNKVIKYFRKQNKKEQNENKRQTRK